MKKLIVLLLALVLTCSLVACSSGDNVRGSISNDAAGENNSTENKQSTTEKQFDVGSVKTNKYTNEFLGVQLTLDSGWIFKTDAEIEQANKDALGMVGDNYKELMENANTFTDMMAATADQTGSIGVGFEKLTGSNTTLTEEQYVEMSKDTLKGALESMGFTNVVLTVSKAKFAGQEHVVVSISCQTNGTPFYESLAVVKCKNYMVTVTTSSLYTDNTKTYLNMFKPLA